MSISGSNADPTVKQSVLQVYRAVFSTVGKDGISELLGYVPSLALIFPEMALLKPNFKSNQPSTDTSSIDQVGSVKKRRRHLFHLLFEALCSMGKPVLLALDNLQDSGENIIESVRDFLVNYLNDSSSPLKDPPHRGMLIVGTLRSNEGEAVMSVIKSIEESRRLVLTVGDLTQEGITKLLSNKLCLPTRYVQGLAGLVKTKTGGNPFFVVQFFKSIVQNGMLEFSTKSNRWDWDLEVIDMQMISDGVAQLLSSRLSQLSKPLLETLKIISCLGCQVDVAIISMLNEEQQLLPINMEDTLHLAIQEGIIDRAVRTTPVIFVFIQTKSHLRC